MKQKYYALLFVFVLFASACQPIVAPTAVPGGETTSATPTPSAEQEETGTITDTTATESEAATVIEATFVCPDGTSIPAVFDNVAGNVTITLPDGELTLPQVISASGARYSDDTTTFWNKGNEATIEVDGTMVYEGCVTE